MKDSTRNMARDNIGPTLAPHRTIISQKAHATSTKEVSAHAASATFARDLSHGNNHAHLRYDILSPSAGNALRSPSLSPLLNSRMNGLPPTPPTQEGEMIDEAIMSPSSLSDVYTDAWASPRMDVSTPIHLTSPPTPDTTPPSTERRRLKVPKPDLSSYPSQADSFVTARETLRSRSSTHSPTYMSPHGSTASVDRRRQFSGLGEVVMSSPLSEVVLPSSNASTSVLGLADALAETSLSQNTAVDSVLGRGKMTPPQTIEPPQGSPTPRKTRPRAHTDTSLTAQSEVSMSPGRKPRHKHRKTPKKDQTAEITTGAPKSPPKVVHRHDALYNHIIDEKSKRLSSTSMSARVEAMVYIAPPQPRRSLRHAGKNLALRNDRIADDLPPTLLPKPEHVLRHHEETLPKRASIATRRNDDEPLQNQAPPREAQRRAYVQHAEQIIAEPSSRQGLRSVDVSRASRQPVADASSSLPTPSRQKSNGWRREFQDQELASPPPLWPQTGFLAHRERIDSVQDDKQQNIATLHTDSAPGTGHLTALETWTSNSTRRASYGQQSSEHHSIRHLPVPTPVSERSIWSDRTHFAEVNDATAVSIHPHHNDSVLLIQQHASQPSAAATKSAVCDKVRKQPSLKVILDTGTPPSGTRSMTSLDSPSMLNPRAAPQPPSFKFIPPTPNDESDRQLILPDDVEERDLGPFSMNVTSALPRRQTSLRQRARAHSTALVDAILFRQPSVGRRRSHASRRRRTIAGPADEYRPRNLHPLWRPRGFWDDFDSDEEEDSLDGDFERPGDCDRLPAGGDTSDVEEVKAVFPRKMSKRLPGFRGSGGFLIGNSLGLGRHGTNSRRPHISLPLDRGGSGSRHQQSMSSGLRKRRSEHALRVIGAASSVSMGQRKGVVGMRGFGFGGLRERVRGLGQRRLEWLAERRRERLRGSIGGPVI